jgi:type II secretory pathway pseudopilin PulG
MARPTTSGEPRVERRGERRARGFTYLLLLGWVAIGGVMLATMGEQWLMADRRERDIELADRGEAIRLALQAYADVPVSPGQSRLPAHLEDLLEDTRTGHLVRHLRRLQPDPVTRGPWGLLHAPDGVGILGVYSRSTATPVRPPKGVTTYGDWRFEIGAM